MKQAKHEVDGGGPLEVEVRVEYRQMHSDDFNIDDVVEPCADEPYLVSLLRLFERVVITEEQIKLIPGMGAEQAIEAMRWLAAHGIDCSEVVPTPKKMV